MGLTAVVALLGITHVSSNHTISKKIEEISTNQVPRIIALEEIKVASLRMITEVATYALLKSELESLGDNSNNTPSFVEEETGEYQEAYEKLQKRLFQLDNLTSLAGEDRKFFIKINQITQEIDQISQQIIQLKSQGKAANTTWEMYENLEELEEIFSENINHQIAESVNQLQREKEVIINDTYQANLFNLILIVLVALLAVALGLLLAENIAKPIIKLKNAAIAIGQGKLDVRVNINSRSEIGILAKAFNNMAEELTKKTVSKHYVDNIFKSLIDALIILNPDGTIRDFNFATLFLLGYEDDTELLGQSISTLLKDRVTYDELATQAGIANSLIGRKEVEFLSKEGEIIPVYFSASVMRKDEGSVEAVVCLVQDIRERKRAEAALRESEHRYHTLAAISPVGIFRINRGGEFLYLNDRLSQITGLSEKQAREGHWFEAIHPNDRDRVIQEWNDAAKEQLPFQSEFRFLHDNGIERWVWGQAVCQTDKDGNGSDYVGTIADITQRKHMEDALQQANDELETRVQNRTSELRQTLEQLQKESLERKLVAEALHESQERLNGILQSIDDVLWSVSGANLEVLYLSPAVETIYQRPPSAFFENFNLWQEVIYPQDRSVVNLAFQNSLETGSSDLEYRIVRPSGDVRWLRQRTRLVRDRDGSPLRIDGIASDITDRKLAEAKLRKSELRYRKLAKQESIINRLTDQIRNSLEIDTILQTAVSEIRSLLQIDRCLFIWYRPHGVANKKSHNGSTPSFSSCWEVVKESRTPDLPSLLGCYPTDPDSSFIAKLLNRETIRVDDVSQSSNLDYQKLQAAWGYQAFVAVPIQTLNGDIGLISCGQCQGPRRWSDRELLLLKAIANQVAIAISQAELYTRATDSARHAREKAQQLQQTLRELQKTQTQLIQTEKMSSLGQMVAGVAHEINNPVSFIYGNIEPANEYIQNLLHLLDLYQTHYAEPDLEIQELIEEIDLEFIIDDLPKLLASMKIGANRIREIVLSLRNFSRLDEAQMKSVNLHEGIDSTLLILQNRLKAKPGRPEIKVIKEYNTLPLIECYGGELNQVFMNLISNAIDAVEQPLSKNNSKQNSAPVSGNNNQTESAATVAIASYSPYIRIQTSRQGNNRVELRISDNGIGMTKEVIQRIFDPFFTTKPVGAGTGLGLSISYQIVVEKHRGKLDCISAPGKGTEFLISLPIHPE